MAGATSVTGTTSESERLSVGNVSNPYQGISPDLYEACGIILAGCRGMILSKHAHSHTTGIPSSLEGFRSAAVLEQTAGYNGAHCRGRAAGPALGRKGGIARRRWKRREKREKRKKVCYPHRRRSFHCRCTWMCPPFTVRAVLCHDLSTFNSRGSARTMKPGRNTGGPAFAGCAP